MRAKKEKKEEAPVQETLGPCLTAAEYWEWRVTISDMEIAKLNHQSLHTQVTLMSKDLEISTLKMQLFRAVKLKTAEEKIESARNEFDRMKKVLEERHGTSLSGKMIDEANFEIKELPQEDTKQTQGG